MPGLRWEKRAGGNDRRAPLLPLVGKQFAKAGLRMAADTHEEVAQVGEGVDPQTLASGDQAGQHCGGPTPIVAAQEHPVFSFMRTFP